MEKDSQCINYFQQPLLFKSGNTNGKISNMKIEMVLYCQDEKQIFQNPQDSSDKKNMQLKRRVEYNSYCNINVEFLFDH